MRICLSLQISRFFFFNFLPNFFHILLQIFFCFKSCLLRFTRKGILCTFKYKIMNQVSIYIRISYINMTLLYNTRQND